VAVATVAVVTRSRRRQSRWDPELCRVRLNGRTAIVTGANTGIGYCVAVDLARRGARVILACRSQARGELAARSVAAESGSPRVLYRQLDLSSLSSVREFVSRVMSEEERLDILVNNAGVSGLPHQITDDGLEVTYATNHLGPFLLTNLLLDLLKQGSPSRVVTLSSVQHRQGHLHLPHLTGQQLPQGVARNVDYNNSKLMNVLFTRHLATKLAGTGVSASAVHPGVVNTEVIRHANWLVRVVFKAIGLFFLKSPVEGAIPVLYCCLAEEMSDVSGKYLDSDCILREPSRAARDPIAAERLWVESVVDAVVEEPSSPGGRRGRGGGRGAAWDGIGNENGGPWDGDVGVGA
ncbi:unnamed protein product, partial [Lampetra fluviatilis]